MENSREVEKIEYEIRKLERGIKVAHRNKSNVKDEGIDYDSIIKQYTKDIKELKDRLEELTEKRCFSSGRWKILTRGRRQPNIPKWPI
jgi:septal ring factor EnvC (AmiA/AmiB activator)